MANWHISSDIEFIDQQCSIMGILNATPDSFFDGGNFNRFEKACTHAQKMVASGAKIIDIGGESSKPGAVKVSLEDELLRVIPLVKWCSQEFKNQNIAISVDTTKSVVAEESIKSGAQIINDISALQADPEMINVILKHKVAIVLNHMQGTPQTMQIKPSYQSCSSEIFENLTQTAQILIEQGLNPNSICLDPGIGFGKSIEHNIDLLKNIEIFTKSPFATLIGTSRKSLFGQMAGLENSNRLIPSVASALLAAQKNVRIVRVHDVLETAEAITFLNQIS